MTAVQILDGDYTEIEDALLRMWSCNAVQPTVIWVPSAMVRRARRVLSLHLGQIPRRRSARGRKRALQVALLWWARTETGGE